MAVRIIVVILLVQTASLAFEGHCDFAEWRCFGLRERADIVRTLSGTPGKHLVIVQYNRFHYIHNEWVYNGAEIDTAKIVWAREMDVAQNKKLLDYFKDRQIWLVRPDELDPVARQLKPYPTATVQPLP